MMLTKSNEISSKLIHYEAARISLKNARRIDEVKEIHDQAMALQAYAKQRNDNEMQQWLSEIKLRATVRIGEISKGLDRVEAPAKHEGKGGRLPSTGKSTKAQILKAAGISTSTANRWEQLAEEGALPIIEQYIAEQSSIGKTVNIDTAISRSSKTIKEKK